MQRVKKSQSGNISPIWGEAPTVPTETKIFMACNLADIITCAKFQDNILRGYNFTRGQISHFLIDFFMGLTRVHLYALPVIIADVTVMTNCITRVL